MEIKKGLFSYLLIFILSVAIVGAVTQISSNYISVDELKNATKTFIRISAPLNLTAFNTGDALNDEIEAYFGSTFGAVEIGDTQLFQSDLILSGLNLNGTFITRNKNGNSSIKFAWVGKK